MYCKTESTVFQFLQDFEKISNQFRAHVDSHFCMLRSNNRPVAHPPTNVMLPGNILLALFHNQS